MVVQRRRKKKGGFLFGTVVGVAAGLAGGTALLRRAAAQHEDVEVEVDPETATERARTVAGTVQQAPAAARQRAQGALDTLKARWREAVAEGKVAAAEREAELEEQYARETKRITPPVPPSGSMEVGPNPVRSAHTPPVPRRDGGGLSSTRIPVSSMRPLVRERRSGWHQSTGEAPPSLRGTGEVSAERTGLGAREKAPSGAFGVSGGRAGGGEGGI